ncbi:MAG: peptidylprolyl isomerase [Cytophagales bacterium]|nr:peptidylprolyl isomerase [Cytophagales bacterium]
MLVTGLLVLILSGVQAQPIGTVVDEIIARVDDEIVLKSELEQSYLQLLRSGQVMGRTGRCQVLESIIINKMMVVKAQKDSVEVSEAEIEGSLDQRMQYFLAQFGSEEAFEANYGKSVEDFKEELRDKVADQLRADRMQYQITEDIKVTPAEVKRFFKRFPQDSIPFFSTEVVVGQIVKKPGVSRSQKEAVRAKLNEIRDAILAGDVDFESMARKYSEEPAAEKTGGNLGFAKRKQMVPAFEAAALRLKPNEISKPVETDFGLHIIQLLERRGNEYNSRHILMRVPSSELDWEETYNFLDSVRNLIAMDSISFEKAAKDLSDDQASAASGGYLTDGTGSARVSVEELESNLFFMLDTMKTGTVSHPVRMIMRDGTAAMRIIYYKERVAPHMASLEQDYQRIQFAALNEKKNQRLSEWFSQAQEDVYIDIDPEYDYCEILKGD